MSERKHGVIALFDACMRDYGFTPEQAAAIASDEVDNVMPADRWKTLLRIFTDLHALYQDDDVIRKWLDSPQAKLDGETPRAMMVRGEVGRVGYYVAVLSGRW